MKVIKNPPGRGYILKILYTFAFIFNLFFISEAAYAESYKTTISVKAEPYISWEVETGRASTLEYPITVNTNSPYGYALRLQTLGSTSALESNRGERYNIPTIQNNGFRTTIETISNGYGYSTDGVNFLPVPSPEGDGDLIAAPAESTPNEDEDYTITFGMKIDSSYVSGSYSKSFVVTAIANAPIVCEAEYICYIRNGSDVEGGQLDDQGASSNSDVMLQAPNFVRDGYGFVGWNTQPDGSGTSYGPNETIRAGDLSNAGLILFAQWQESEGELQGWTGCETMQIGDVIALTDNRDGNTYAIVKNTDGACWMMENLRLDFSDQNVEITSSNTNNPTNEFMNIVNQHPASQNWFCDTDAEWCINQFYYNSDNVKIDSDSTYPSYGTFFNWYAATAGNGTYSNANPDVPVAGDICPVGWRLPTGNGMESDLVLLDIALGGNGSNDTVEADSKRWRKYPANYMLSGQFKGSARTDVGVSGNYYASNPSTNVRAMNLWLLKNKASFNANAALKHRGQSVRCIIKNNYKIKYDKNNTAAINGEMKDQKVARDIEAKLHKNTFSHTYADHVWYRFLNWNTKADGSGTSYDDEAVIKNLAETDEEITLYAQWEEIRYADVTARFDELAISNFTLKNDVYGTTVLNNDNAVAHIAIGKTYTIFFDLDAGYKFVRYSTTENGELGDENVSPTTYIVVNGDATITITTAVRDTQITMQNMESAACSSVPVVAIDTRDNQEYLVQRLADGNCWMIDDLRLGSSELVEAISSENTNVSDESTFVLPTSSKITDNYTIAQLNADNAGQSINSFGSTSGKAGVYYNYCAASAGTVCSKTTPQAAEEDVCPVGWRLPTGGANGEQKALFDLVGGTAQLAQPALSLTFSGWYDYHNGGTVKEFETASWLWSSTPKNVTDKSYEWFIGRTKNHFTEGVFENYGLGIRCVMK